MKSLLFFCVVLLFGCGSQFGRHIETRFPTKTELVELGNSTRTNTYLKDRTPGKHVETWKLTGPLPTQLGESTAVPTNAFEILLAQKVDLASNLNMTDSMNCVAREHAVFYTAHNAPPFQSLQRFIESRCGSFTGNVQTLLIDAGTVSDAEALSAATPQIEHYAKQFAGFNSRVNTGIAYAKTAGRSVIVMAYEQPRMKMSPTSIRSQSGMFVIQGKLETGEVPLRFQAQFTKGAFGTGKCLAQPVDPPAFKFVCTLDLTDSSSYLSISYQMKDALFLKPLANILVYPGEVSDTYVPPKTRQILVSSGQNSKKGTLLETLNVLINSVRSSAGRAPISGHVAQTESIQSLTMAFFDSNDDVGKLNKVILGMMAGWEINDEIVDSGFASTYIDTSNPAQLLESILETPGGRNTLLAESVSAFGVGTISKPGAGMGAVFVSYDFMNQEHSNRRIERVVAALNTERDIYGAKPIKENKSTRFRAENWARELENGAAMEDIAEKLRAAYADETGKKTVNAYMLLVPNLDDMTFPGSIVNKKNLKPSFVVAPYKPLNSPWTFYAVILAY